MQKVIDGTLTNYEIIGGGDRDLVILHGWMASMEEWMSTANYFGARYRVILVDLPGFGGSMAPPANWGIYEYGEFVVKFLQSLEIKRATVIGHSFGGRVGMIMAAKTDLVEKLILVDAAGVERRSARQVMAGWLSPLLRWLPQGVKNLAGSDDYRKAGDMRGVFVKVVNQPLWLVAGEVRSPTLIVWGEKDRVLPVWQGKEMRNRIANSRLRIVWGAGHFPHLEKPEEFREILEEEGV